MERLTLDEAIKHAKEVAKTNRAEATYNFPDLKEYYDNCSECANQHNQLAEWLEELKTYKDIGTPKELRELKENGAFTGLELAKLAIMQKELKKYKDLEEQGLLVKLPCKVGDIIWDNDFGYPQSYEINAYSYGYCDSYVESYVEEEVVFYFENSNRSMTGSFPMSEIGKTVFLTREEAAEKLEEMKKND